MGEPGRGDAKVPIVLSSKQRCVHAVPYRCTSTCVCVIMQTCTHQWHTTHTNASMYAYVSAMSMYAYVSMPSMHAYVLYTAVHCPKLGLSEREFIHSRTHPLIHAHP